MTSYTCSFIFDHAGRVLLVKKTHKPKIVVRKWNGVSGGLFPGEDILEGAIRELEEETTISLDTLRFFCTLRLPYATVYFFTGTVPSLPSLHLPRVNDVNELLGVYDPAGFQGLVSTDAVVPNLKWLVPLALDEDAMCVDATSADDKL